MSSTTPATRASNQRERMAAGLLILMLLVHLGCAVLGWTTTGLVHNGFREAQTGISALFIQRDQDFSLAYPTPVLGPPWSAPMEFPLYQWTVVKVSDGLGLPLPQAGRLVSLLCFYLTLPAWYLLLRRLGLDRWRGFLVLALIISAPLYLFYARAFLIETMALMFSAWFLLGYVRAGESRRPVWLAAALAAGLAAALVKVTTLLFFLMPAAVWTLVWLRDDWRTGPGRRGAAIVRRVGWCLPVALVPLAAALWWVSFADQIKAQSSVAEFLTSENLKGFNFGAGRRFTADTWSQHLHIWFTELAPWPLWLAWAALGVAFARRWWMPIAWLLTFFIVVQAIFPLLYAFHAYYYVANAWTLLMVVGLVTCGIVESRLPRWLAWSLVFGLSGAQAAYGLHHHWAEMHEKEPGHIQFIRALQEATDPDDVLIVAGDDWSSVIPYYAERRALMLRTGVEDKPDYLRAALEPLKAHKVGALILRDLQRNNHLLIGMVRDELGIDTEPAFTWKTTTVFVAQGTRADVRSALLERVDLPEIDVPDWQEGLKEQQVSFEKVPPRYRSLFSGIHPQPTHFLTTFGLGRFESGDRSFFDAHATTRLWFRLPAGEHTMTAEVGMLEGAHDENIPYGDRTDGIEIILARERPGEEPEVLFSRRLDPRADPADRGMQQLEHRFTLEKDETVLFTVHPGPSNSVARDWTLLGNLEFR